MPQVDTSEKEKTRYVIYTTVDHAAEGFVHFEGSRESIYLDSDFAPGDKVKITFEKVT